ncbi:hypothetical protein AXFE_02600 [Acidithrix ferrooxidans]|uniref:Uncharacterized protein n=1 Tax=Acidithrix ferrooxidans TaxID=1280514 RepID=A0A0D8HLK5_9ACTN|nr:hypothetical protein AXFE_02600 [Acidithrix ferrooxidans]
MRRDPCDPQRLIDTEIVRVFVKCRLAIIIIDWAKFG